MASRREDLNKDYQARIINPRPSAGDCYEELTNGIVRISAWLYTVALVLINHIISFSSSLTRSAKVLADRVRE